MTEYEITRRVQALNLPDVMTEEKETLFELYDQILEDLEIDSESDAAQLNRIVIGWFEDILHSFTASAKRELLSNADCTYEDVPAILLDQNNNGQYVACVPCLIADWIGFIGYIKKKYGIRA